MFMEKLIQEYLNWKGIHAPRASINYRIWLYRFITVCGVKDLQEYATNDVVRYHDWLQTRYSSYSIQFATVAIKNFFQYCTDSKLNCISPTFIKIPRVNAKSHRAITEKEFNRVISIIPSNDFRSLRDLVIVRLLWDTGMRVSELCDLNLSDIDETIGKATISTKKTRRMRTVIWSSATHTLLMKYMPIRLELDNIHRTGSLFVGWRRGFGWSSKLTSRTVQRRIQYFVRSVGIKEKITPHSFRHGWAHKRRDQNAPLAFIQRGLGHINPASTFIYEQYTDHDFEKKAKAYLK